MKKKYFAPVMEELEFDEPVVLQETEASTGSETLCTTESCVADSCPKNYD
jgi:hypothetical protein